MAGIRVRKTRSCAHGLHAQPPKRHRSIDSSSAAACHAHSTAARLLARDMWPAERGRRGAAQRRPLLAGAMPRGRGRPNGAPGSIIVAPSPPLSPRLQACQWPRGLVGSTRGMSVAPPSARPACDAARRAPKPPAGDGEAPGPLPRLSAPAWGRREGERGRAAIGRKLQARWADRCQCLVELVYGSKTACPRSVRCLHRQAPLRPLPFARRAQPGLRGAARSILQSRIDRSRISGRPDCAPRPRAGPYCRLQPTKTTRAGRPGAAV